MKDDNRFTFNISLTILNHLGRNLYRNFSTILGEAISNSWDADAKNVEIVIDKDNDSFLIKDDGIGMSVEDFQNKFLRIGYSKRNESGSNKSPKGRPFIGRKGIGKLALLSCAEKVSISSKTKGNKIVGGIINNSLLDDAIKNDLTPQEYTLGELDIESFKGQMKDFSRGTVIHFEGIKEGINHTPDFLKKIIALYFKFSLIDDSFNIYVDGDKITHKHLKDLADETQFLWNINDLKDPYIDKMLTSLDEKEIPMWCGLNVKGFISSVRKPRHLNINTTEEKVSVDLFVNGRLREKDFIRHISTDRIAESYIYGQIHFDDLDDEIDRFTSNRESVKLDDHTYREFLEQFKKDILLKIVEEWDVLRIKNRDDGDPENPRLTRKERSSKSLYGAVSEDYVSINSKSKSAVDEWVDDFEEDATFNFGSYAECFISENLIRKHIKKNSIPLTPEAQGEADMRKYNEKNNKERGNISIDIRAPSDDSIYLSMGYLANLVDKKDPLIEACLIRDSNEYKPIRDALMHTALLTNEAKKKLTSIYENIKGRVRTLTSKD